MDKDSLHPDDVSSSQANNSANAAPDINVICGFRCKSANTKNWEDQITFTTLQNALRIHS